MAVLLFSRKRKMTPDRCLSTDKPQHVDRRATQAPDAVAVAVEHVNHLRRAGVGITQAFPDMAMHEIARVFGTNQGRVSEILFGKRA